MTKSALAAIALSANFLLSATTTQAADAIDPMYDWSGFYLGAHLGHTWADVDYNFPNGPSASLDPNGVTFGGLLGYNHQMDQFVLGIEADYTFDSNLNDDTGGLGGFQSQYELEGYGSLRARLGYAQDRFLVFGTAGVAIVDAYTNDPGDGNSDISHLGLAVGAGAEYAVTDSFRLRAEYQGIFSDTDKFNILAGAQDNAQIDIHTMRAAAIFNF